MPEQNKTFVSIDSIVRSALGYLGETSTHKYQQFLFFALEAYKSFDMDISLKAKSTEIDLTDWNAIKYPDDFIDWITVGIGKEDKVLVLSLNNKLNLVFEVDDCGDPIAHTDINCVKSNSGNYFQSFGRQSDYSGYVYHNLINENGEHKGTLYGSGGDLAIGEFRVNPDRGEIQLNAGIRAIGTKIYLEYISNDLSPTQETKIHPYAQMMIRLYIVWHYYESAPRFELKKHAPRAEELYYIEQTKVIARLSGLTLDDIQQAYRGGYTPTVKT